MAKALSALSSIVSFAALLVVGQSAARSDRTAARPASSAQIQSPSLGIEFDKNLRSRVVARLEGKEVPLGTFSASETVKGNERSWYDFALASPMHERVTVRGPVAHLSAAFSKHLLRGSNSASGLPKLMADGRP